jgi:hypothetical protein
MTATLTDLRQERARRTLPAPALLTFGRPPEWYAAELIRLAVVAAWVGLIFRITQ